MKASETAVVLIEFQNEFCKEGGKLHEGVKEEMTRQNTIENARKLAQGAREKGALVIHSPFVFNPEFFEAHQMQGIVKAAAEGEAFREGTWGASIIDEMQPAPEDEVVAGKCTLCGFSHTNLQEILDKHNIKNVCVAGFLSNVCVESTARSAYDKGYRVVIAKDATGCNSADAQSYVEENIYPILGGAMSVEEFLDQLEG